MSSALPLRVCLGVLVLLPLAALPSLLAFPFVTTKAVLLHGVTAVVLAILAARVALGRAALPRFDAPAAALGALVIVMLLTSVVAGNPAQGLLDDLERMVGVTTVGCALVTFLVTRTVVTTDEARLRWLAASAAVAVPIAVLAALQVDGATVFGIPSPGRPPGTLGHPAYLGAAGLFWSFSGAVVVTSARRRILRGIGAAGALAGCVCVVLCEARSSLLALLAGALATLVVRAIRDVRGGRERRLLQWCVSAGLLAAATVVLLIKSPWAREIPVVRRLAGASLQSFTIATRTMVWDSALDAWLERPWLGWGPGRFVHAFEAHYPPALLHFGFGETWFDDAHNLILNTLVEQGVAGGIALLVLVATLTRTAARDVPHGPDRLLRTGLPLGFVVAHFVDKLFVFESVTSWVQLALFAGLALAPSVPGGLARARARWAALPLGALSIVLVACATVPTALAALRGREAAALVARGEPAADAMLDRAIEASPSHAGEVAHLVCAATTLYAPRLARHVAGHAIAARGRHALSRQREHSDLRARDVVTRAKLVLAVPELRADATLIAQVTADLDAAAVTSPERQEIAFLRSRFAQRNGDAARAVALLRSACAAETSVSEPWFRLIRLLVTLERPRDARRELESAREAGVRFTAANEARIRAWLPRDR